MNNPPVPESAAPPQPLLTRRRVLALGLSGLVVVAAAGTVGFELVSHGVLPGKLRLEELEGGLLAARNPASLRRARP